MCRWTGRRNSRVLLVACQGLYIGLRGGERVQMRYSIASSSWSRGLGQHTRRCGRSSHWNCCLRVCGRRRCCARCAQQPPQPSRIHPSTPAPPPPHRSSSSSACPSRCSTRTPTATACSPSSEPSGRTHGGAGWAATRSSCCCPCRWPPTAARSVRPHTTRSTPHPNPAPLNSSLHPPSDQPMPSGTRPSGSSTRKQRRRSGRVRVRCGLAATAAAARPYRRRPHHWPHTKPTLNPLPPCQTATIATTVKTTHHATPLSRGGRPRRRPAPLGQAERRRAPLHPPRARLFRRQRRHRVREPGRALHDRRAGARGDERTTGGGVGGGVGGDCIVCPCVFVVCVCGARAVCGAALMRRRAGPPGACGASSRPLNLIPPPGASSRS